MLKKIFLFGLLIVSNLCLSSHAPEKQLDLVIDVIERRLAVMHGIALWKFENNSQVWHPAREKQILNALRKRANERGLDPEWVEEVLQGQMDAAKIIQWVDLDTWRTTRKTPEGTPPDLFSEVRPQLDQLSTELFEELAGLSDHIHDPALKIRLNKKINELSERHHEHPLVWKLALTPLLHAP